MREREIGRRRGRGIGRERPRWIERESREIWRDITLRSRDRSKTNSNYIEMLRYKDR